MNSSFDGKTIVITGASAGVGAACARHFARAGANLVLAARGAKQLAHISEELRSYTSVVDLPMDVTSVEACTHLVSASIAAYGRIDVLVNNAGMHSRGDFHTRSTADIAAMVDTNLRAPLVLASAALAEIKKNQGAIVMVGSLAGRTPLQGAATYAATKAGLRSFTYALHDELSSANVRVGIVSPGPIDTGFIMEEIDLVEDIVFSQPMSTTDEVADSILRLATQDVAEIAMPPLSGLLTTLSYLFPSLRRALRPRLYAVGRKNKQKYRDRNVEEQG